MYDQRRRKRLVEAVVHPRWNHPACEPRPFTSNLPGTQFAEERHGARARCSCGSSAAGTTFTGGHVEWCAALFVGRVEPCAVHHKQLNNRINGKGSEVKSSLPRIIGAVDIHMLLQEYLHGFELLSLGRVLV